MTLRTPQGHVLEQIDGRDPTPRSGEILLFGCVRNEELRLPYFLDYYRSLGVSRFYLIDNASTDGTAEILRTAPDVHTFHTAASYSDGLCGVHWLNTLLAAYGTGAWVVVVDVDELLYYPRCESVALPKLAASLEGAGHDALLTFLLDMYSGGPIRTADYVAGTPFLRTCGFFDTDSYTLGSEGLRAKIPDRGGVRRRLFWPQGQHRRGQPPYLPKVPFVKWSRDLQYLASTHVIEGVRLWPSTGVLLHFKLFSDFVDRVEDEVSRGEHWDDAAQYSAYAQTLAESPDLNPMYPGSAAFEGSRQLVDLGLMVDHEDPRVSEEDPYAEHWDYYVKELFPGIQRRGPRSASTLEPWRVLNTSDGEFPWPGDEWGARADTERVIDSALAPFLDAPVGNLCEIGSGSGRYTTAVLDRFSDARVLSFDISSEFIAKLRDRCAAAVDVGRLETFHLNRQPLGMLAAIERLGLRGAIDAIYSFDALVHVDLHTIAVYIVTAARSLRTGGIVSLNVADAGTENGFMKLLADAPTGYTRRGLGGPIFMWVGGDQVQYVLTRCGFEVERLDCNGRDAFLTARLRDPGAVEEWMGRAGVNW